jgi:DNA-binding GntR family transcriptional regulator
MMDFVGVAVAPIQEIAGIVVGNAEIQPNTARPQADGYRWIIYKIGDKSMLLRDHIYQTIRHAILTCEFRPGQDLREQILAKQYRVSRSPVRDSLLRLELEHLVTVLPRQGYRVNPVSISDTGDILGLRLLVEPACAAAASQADDADLRLLDGFRGFTDNYFDETSSVEHNAAFHRAVAGLSSNKRMATVSIDLTEQFERLVRADLRAFTPESVHRMCAEHDAIIDALQAHDADRAFRLAYEHTKEGQARYGMAHVSPIQAKEGPADGNASGDDGC